jgi:hypothetical protein
MNCKTCNASLTKEGSVILWVPIWKAFYAKLEIDDTGKICVKHNFKRIEKPLLPDDTRYVICAACENQILIQELEEGQKDSNSQE